MKKKPTQYKPILAVSKQFWYETILGDEEPYRKGGNPLLPAPCPIPFGTWFHFTPSTEDHRALAYLFAPMSACWVTETVMESLIEDQRTGRIKALTVFQEEISGPLLLVSFYEVKGIVTP